MSRLVLILACAALAGCGGSGGAGTSTGSGEKQGLVVGAVEDAAKSGNAQAQMKLAADSGFSAIALSAVWEQGQRTPPPPDLRALKAAVSAAAKNGIRPIVAVYQFSSSTPVSPEQRAAFAAYTAALVQGLPDVHDVIVGNEPNLNLFWMPQFDASGGDAAASSFEQLLAATYDAVKQARDDVQVIGAGVSPRGSDDASSSRPTHSPTRFLLDLGAAYRASGRTRPIMDALAIHPYGETPRVPPTLAHPNTTSLGIADYRTLVDLLGRAFDGTKQKGRTLPVVYGAYGVETTIPPAKQSLYEGHEVVKTVDEATQANYYVRAIQLAACQPTVEMLLVFHVNDEPKLEGLQSGVRYADGSPKSSLARVRDAARSPRCAQK
jgi:hypothetical protein